MLLGIEALIKDRPELIEGKRAGLLAHAASVDAAGRHTLDRLANDGGATIAALFGPEHGFATKAEDMEAVESHAYAASNVPVHSLYGKDLDSLKPTPEMLKGIDALIVDLQDIGSRYYTYIWTTALCMEACAEAKKPIVVCDRPNPIGGELVEGPGIDEGYQSFVGLFPIPVRHGMTIGEIVQLMNDQGGMGCDLSVVPMQGWRRDMRWAEAGLPWVNPSPNMRSYTAALLYPGMCLVEATNISEGRGTDTPFEVAGAPYMDTDELMEAFNALSLPGVSAAPTSFIPTRQKWANRLCHGVRFVVSDEKGFRPYLAGLAFIWLCHRLYRGKGFEWRNDPYEFVTNRPAIDLLTGSSAFREAIDGLSLDTIEVLAKTPYELIEMRRSALLY
ncbi:MAG: DUF1343 domain-containing protein [Proteobacteria bacterium]|nr:DUF1343 domain-containing protein [Pseudomonadota bacterium]